MAIGIDPRRARGLWRATAALGGAALAAAALSACGGDEGPQRFEREGYPFTFEYPGELERTTELELGRELGAGADDRVALARDEDNALIVERFELNRAIDEQNIGLARQELDGLLQRVDPDASGEQGETAGLPSIAYEEVELSRPEDGLSRYLALFDGDRQYLLNCQSTPDGREEIAAACERAIETLEPAAGASS